MRANVLLLLGTPDPKSFNAALAGEYARGATEQGGNVTTLDLGALDFDPVLRRGHREPQTLEPDMLAAREAIELAHHVVWFFPTYWGSPPALVRGFVDRLFLPGWAFRYRGGALPEGLLAGRSSRVVSTMDSPGWWYALAHRWALHATMGTGTLSFCGFSPVSFTLLHGVRDMTEQARQAWLTRMAAVGARDARAAQSRSAVPSLAA